MQNKITPRLVKLARLLSDMTMDEVVKKYNISYYQLKNIERSLDLDLYADHKISTIRSLEQFIEDSGIQFSNDGEFTGIYFANDGTDRKYLQTEANDNLMKLNKKLEQEKKSLIDEAKVELQQVQAHIKDLKSKCENMSKDIDVRSSIFFKKINS